MIDLNALFAALENQPRLLIEAELKPVQGDRFQPTGFPDLGAATYIRPNSDGKKPTPMLLVESAQSVANRLEEVCWNTATDKIIDVLTGLPHVVVDLGNEMQTSSLQESHRLNSAYIICDKPFRDRIMKGVVQDKYGIIDRRKLAAAVFNEDPCSIIHGVFFARSDMAGGRARLQRVLSGFIEAYNAIPATSGGVNMPRLDPTGVDAFARYSDFGESEDEKKSNKKQVETAKSIPYSTTEYTAEKITAYFNLDLVALRGYGLGQPANNLLIALSLFKIMQFLEVGTRLRSRCDFELVENGLTVKRPQNLPAELNQDFLQDLTKQLKQLIQNCGFTEHSIFQITAPPVSKEKLEKAKKKMKDGNKEKPEETENDVINNGETE